MFHGPGRRDWIDRAIVLAPDRPEPYEARLQWWIFNLSILLQDFEEGRSGESPFEEVRADLRVLLDLKAGEHELELGIISAEIALAVLESALPLVEEPGFKEMEPSEFLAVLAAGASAHVRDLCVEALERARPYLEDQELRPLALLVMLVAHAGLGDRAWKDELRALEKEIPKLRWIEDAQDAVLTFSEMHSQSGEEIDAAARPSG